MDGPAPATVRAAGAIPSGRSSDLGSPRPDTFPAGMASGFRPTVPLTALGTSRACTAFPILLPGQAPEGSPTLGAARGLSSGKGQGAGAMDDRVDLWRESMKTPRAKQRRKAPPRIAGPPPGPAIGQCPAKHRCRRHLAGINRDAARSDRRAVARRRAPPKCKGRPERRPSSSRHARPYPFFRQRLPSVSAICTAFSAAPLRRLSLTHQRFRPLSIVPSCRMRLMKVA
ncbi:hypothetical protein LX70_03853 [Defluviimonas denitrificans]|uniref:Uncharacterized protein n=1 Tax=Albidovulum denitrificans TaxID=404881 RepID=A0A2S8RYR4_9RHOB|nr:hypothetical protein LX70_03853 [Defluviimonas denitrificans]